jgi:hypothetical protein
MERASEHPCPISFVRKLCAELSEAEIVEAEERLTAYMKIMIKIAERTERKIT